MNTSEVTIPVSLQPVAGLNPLGKAIDFMDEILEVVQTVEMFDQFHMAEYITLCETMHCYAVPAGATVITEATPGDYLLLVLTGQIEVTKRDSAGQQQVVAQAGPGVFLGEMSMVDGQLRFATCTAKVPTDFAVLTHDNLKLLMRDHPVLGCKLLLLLLQLATTRLRESTTRMLPASSGEWV